MKLLILGVTVFVILGFVILFMADRLGFEVEFPRGATLLTIMDLAVIKGFLLIYMWKEIFK